MYQVESHAQGPGVSSAQYSPVVPGVFELKVCRRSLCPSRIERALRSRVDVHFCRAFCTLFLILDGPRPGHARVAQGGARRHEQRVVYVARVGEHREVERQEPGFAAGDDAEVGRAQGRVGEGVV